MVISAPSCSPLSCLEGGTLYIQHCKVMVRWSFGNGAANVSIQVQNTLLWAVAIIFATGKEQIFYQLKDCLFFFLCWVIGNGLSLVASASTYPFSQLEGTDFFYEIKDCMFLPCPL